MGTLENSKQSKVAHSSTHPSVSDLSRLALKAALQLDAMQRKVTPPEANYLQQLLKRLKHDLDDHPSEQQVRRLAPPHVEVLSKAADAYSGQPTVSYQELASKINDIMRALQNTVAGSDTVHTDSRETHIEKLVEFCTALHDALLQQRSLIDQSRRPKNPRRY